MSTSSRDIAQTWTIPGCGDLPIHGETDLPSGEPRGCAIIVHGFMGYGTYGFMPWIGRSLADLGILVHRPTLSTSGIDPKTTKFAHADRFARQTWNAQVQDIGLVISAIQRGTLGPKFDSVLLIGHSRGGVVSLLAAGRPGELARSIAGVITIAAPDSCCALNAEDQAAFLADGGKDYESGRTGEKLRLDRAWLDEQLQDPAAHDVPAIAANITAPTLLIHGSADPTVDHQALGTLAEAMGPKAACALISGADHVLCTPNPFDPTDAPPPALRQAMTEIEIFAQELFKP